MEQYHARKLLYVYAAYGLLFKDTAAHGIRPGTAEEFLNGAYADEILPPSKTKNRSNGLRSSKGEGAASVPSKVFVPVLMS